MASYIADGVEDSLETRLNKATNPLMLEENWEHIIGFCDMVNKDVDGPQMAVRLLVHKIQSPQEKESLFALTTLEACVKNCGTRFQQEIGKFRFINEIIKVISPKYLGNHMSVKVKNKCISLLYFWSQSLNHEPKIKEAYTMLKKQRVVKEDPDVFSIGCSTQDVGGAVQPSAPPPPPLPPVTPPAAEAVKKGNSIFEDEEKSKLLSRLLKSKNTEDPQAANRLIKNMVKQDAERVEKVTRRAQQLETVSNNVKLLNEMLQNYQPGDSTESDREIMKELSENIEKQRPALFKLASDSDEKENSGIGEILKANDDVIQVLSLYDSLVNQSDVGNLLAIDESTKKPTSISSSDAAKKHQHYNSILDGHISDVGGVQSLVDEQLLSLGLPVDTAQQQQQPPSSSSSSARNNNNNNTSMTSTTTSTSLPSTRNNNDDLTELKDIFSMNTNIPTLIPGQFPSSSSSSIFPYRPPPYSPSAPPTTTTTTTSSLNNVNILQQLQQQQQKFPTSIVGRGVGGGSLPNRPMPNNPISNPIISTASGNIGASTSLAPSKYPNLFQSTSSVTASESTTTSTSNTMAISAGLGSLDELSKSLLQETLTSSGLKPFVLPANPVKISRNEMSVKSVLPTTSNPASSSSSPSSVAAVVTNPLSPSSTTTTSVTTTSNATDTSSKEHDTTLTINQNGDAKNKFEGISLEDVAFPLESFKPNKKPSIEIYNQNNIRITFHFSDHQPKPNIHVVVVTTTSTSLSAVKDFCFLATVSKPMRVKVRSASSREFKPYNPILPPDVIAQLLFVANPLQEPIRLKFKVSYNLDDDDIILDVGEVNDIPLF